MYEGKGLRLSLSLEGLKGLPARVPAYFASCTCSSGYKTGIRACNIKGQIRIIIRVRPRIKT